MRQDFERAKQLQSTPQKKMKTDKTKTKQTNKQLDSASYCSMKLHSSNTGIHNILWNDESVVNPKLCW